jgi:hypothetical protein
VERNDIIAKTTEIAGRATFMAFNLLGKVATRFIGNEEAEYSEEPITLHPDERGKPTIKQDRRDLTARRRRDRQAREFSLPPDRVYAVMRERRALERRLVHDHQATVK